MSDFSANKGLAIPEGVVTQIADAAGNVIWKAAPKEATVTCKGTGTSTANVAYVEIDGTRYSGISTNIDEVIVQAGTVIICTVKYASYNGSALGGTITLNGTVVAKTTSSTDATYEYTVTRDVTIAFGATSAPNGQTGGTITITET